MEARTTFLLLRLAAVAIGMSSRSKCRRHRRLCRTSNSCESSGCDVGLGGSALRIHRSDLSFQHGVAAAVMCPLRCKPAMPQSTPTMSDTPATCPRCDRPGTLGAPCSDPSCQRRGYHHIPGEYWERFTSAPSTARDPMVGRHVGDYLIVDKLGEGGFGKVFLGACCE